MFKKAFRFFSVLAFVLSLGFLSYKLISSVVSQPKELYGIHFSEKTYELIGFKTDSLYYFNAVILNTTDSTQGYKLSATCGCTVMSNSERTIEPFSSDTVRVAINTYNKRHDFSSNLVLYNANNSLLDSMTIKVSGLEYE